MGTLMYLYVLKLKGSIRNIFSKPASAIFAILMILFYGGMFVMTLVNPDKSFTMGNLMNINIAIFIGIAFTALMVGIILMQKRKSLFMENDAFYLFAGPFKRPQIMQFLMSSSLMSSLMSGAISLFMMVMLGGSLGYDAIFLALTFITHSMTYIFFVVLNNYIYLLSIKDEKYKRLSWIVMSVFLLIVAVVFLLSAQQVHFDMEQSFLTFLDSDVFYIVPFFGWIKLVLVSYVAGNIAMVFAGLLLLLAGCGTIYVLMCRYKDDFVERAMQDAVEFTARYNEIIAGKKSSFNDKKVHDVKSNFREGAAAIFSKNMLIMRKSNDFVRYQDVLLIIIYLVIALILDVGFSFYMTMLIFAVFINVQNSDFMKEMNNYQIYLIPDRPIKKLWYLVFPSYLKQIAIFTVPIIIAMFLFQASIMEGIQFYILICGFTALFLSASVLSMRILRSRNNPIMESMLRMLIIGASCIPSIIFVVAYVKITGTLSLTTFSIMAWILLVFNFVITALILYGCRNMMNGREIVSD